MATTVQRKTRQLSSSDLRNLVHYNSERPKSTPIEIDNQDDESTFSRYVRPASVVPQLSHSNDLKNEKPATIVETTPLLTERRESNLTSSVESIDSVFSWTNFKEKGKGYFSFKNKFEVLNHLKIVVLLAVAIACFIGIIIKDEKDEEWHLISVDNAHLTYEDLHIHDINNVTVKIKGPFKQGNTSASPVPILRVNLSETMEPNQSSQDLTFILKNMDKNFYDENDLTVYQHDFKVRTRNSSLLFETNSNHSIPLYYSVHEHDQRVILAVLVLVGVYILIIFDLVHRAMAALIGSLAAIAVLAHYGERPDLNTIISWIDMETLMLLFGMMILVSIFSETGFFDFFALKAYKTAKGKIWPLITLLCAFSAIVSAFLDNVTTILLLTPVTIRLCEVLNLDPKKILIAEVLFSNIGGTATGIGDPPNVIIVSTPDFKPYKDTDFSMFTLHMFPGIILVSFVGYGVMRLFYTKMDSLENPEPIDVAEMRHEINVWRRAAARVNIASREESIMKALFLQKATEKENALIRLMYNMRNTKQTNFEQNVTELERKYYITDHWLLVKCTLVLFVVIIFFFLHSFINGVYISLGWIAVVGAIILMILADIKELENIFHRVEWATLIFFAALFVLMEALKELGLIDEIGKAVGEIIGNAGDKKLLVAVLLILWVSAFASSFIDNIPYTTAMIPVLVQLTENEQVPILPMILALAFGACLGGNGTLIGASANVVCAGIADQHGYGFSFWEFFKVGFPMMVVSNIVAMGYLLLFHVAIEWHPSVQDQLK
ncbi:P protein-like [Mytilus galloprovincialis]|uniref:P protein-like n=1 Tax=Mytilus galloprovincialis TaxID=29158 RepID=UPI003F7BA6F7